MRSENKKGIFFLLFMSTQVFNFIFNQPEHYTECRSSFDHRVLQRELRLGWNGVTHQQPKKHRIDGNSHSLYSNVYNSTRSLLLPIQQ